MNLQKNIKTKGILAILLVLCAFCIAWYWLSPRSITRHTDKPNFISSTDSSVLVPIVIGINRYSIPAPYLQLVGVWHPDLQAYGPPFSMAVNAVDFSAFPRNTSSYGLEKEIFVWVEQTSTKNSEQSAVLENTKKSAPKTLAEFEKKSKERLLPSPLVRAPDIDKSGLVGYRGGGGLGDEKYVRQRISGGIYISECQANNGGTVPLCFEIYDRDGLHIDFKYPKRYVTDGESFLDGLNGLIDQFKIK